MQPFGRSRYEPRIGGCAPLGEESRVPILHNVARAEAYLHDNFHLDPSVWPQYTNVTDRTDWTDRTEMTNGTDIQTGQRSDSTGRTVLQTVAQKLASLQQSI